ncbi:MAG: rhomboid family intramembrane serine protease [Solobacterium sp.]|nr:rhomboid family intramembrane serine protease [Solobacterium sp.]MBR2794245.1 rhomboid family intramembrane serine protease [Solobacterium sp.]
MIIGYGAIAVCVVLFFVITRSQYPLDTAVKYGALLPSRVKRGEYWRLLASGFLHVQIWHLLMNMYSLYSLSSLERVFGHGLFALILLASILLGSVLSVWLGDENTITIGISGGLYGLFAAYLVLLFKAGLLQDQAVMFSVLRTLVVNLAINFMPNVSRLGHAGGFIAGFVIAMIML